MYALIIRAITWKIAFELFVWESMVHTEGGHATTRFLEGFVEGSLKVSVS